MPDYGPHAERRASSLFPQDRRLPPLPSVPKHRDENSLGLTGFLHDKSKACGSPASPASSWSGASVRADSFSPQLPSLHLATRKPERYTSPAPVAAKRKAEHIDEHLMGPPARPSHRECTPPSYVQSVFAEPRAVYLPPSGLPTAKRQPRNRRDYSSSDTFASILALAEANQTRLTRMLAKLDKNDNGPDHTPEP